MARGPVAAVATTAPMTDDPEVRSPTIVIAPVCPSMVRVGAPATS